MFIKSIDFQNIRKIPWCQDGYGRFQGNNFANFCWLQLLLVRETLDHSVCLQLSFLEIVVLGWKEWIDINPSAFSCSSKLPFPSLLQLILAFSCGSSEVSQHFSLVLGLCPVPGSGCCNCAVLVYWSLAQLSCQIHACVTAGDYASGCH